MEFRCVNSLRVTKLVFLELATFSLETLKLFTLEVETLALMTLKRLALELVTLELVPHAARQSTCKHCL